MGAIGYLYRKTLFNRIKKALHRPVTYFYLAIIAFYVFALPFSLGMWAARLNGDSPSGMAAVLSVLAFWVIPGNLIAYAKRKGLVYRNSDVHFLFPSPVGPKQVLLYAHLRTLTMQILLNVFAIVCGRVVFHVEVWKLAVYFLFSIVVENLLEGSIMMLLYGSEKLREEHRRMVVAAAYGLVVILVLMGICAYLRDGLSMQSAAAFLHSDMVQRVPLIGWYIAVIHLLFVGATAVNVTGAVCYAVLLAAVVIAACRMKCSGAFYEDAMKFAEDYEEVLASRRQGETRRLGKKRKFGHASVNWKGSGAKALFYRQLLEYKKSRFFIFDASTVVSILGGAGIAWFYVREGGFGGLDAFGPFVIPAVSSYLIFVFTALNGKWAKELTSPYTYMIPDTPFRKLMNATAMQHVQSLVNACLITLPGAVVMKMPPVLTVLCIFAYVALSANKLYVLAVAEVVVGSTIGVVGRQLFQMLFQGIAITMAIMGAILGMGMGGMLEAYILMDVLLALYTVIFMVIATLNFYNMEAA